MAILSDLAFHAVRFLNQRSESSEGRVLRPRLDGATVFWFMKKDGWITPCWFTVRNRSKDADLVRFTNKRSITVPKSRWPFDLPRVYGFELTALVKEADEEMLFTIIEYAELSRNQPAMEHSPPDQFTELGKSGSYAWTKGAEQHERAARSRR